jgi:hypothetical protein
MSGAARKTRVEMVIVSRVVFIILFYETIAFDSQRDRKTLDYCLLEREEFNGTGSFAD